jgi:hypothetical protein
MGRRANVAGDGRKLVEGVEEADLVAVVEGGRQWKME